MFAHVTSLRYWKSERADITTCEDAERSNVSHGLFCVADGAGTTLFSNIWADILVEQFVQNPLMSDDPFEMEWWIRQAQKRYRDLAPKADKLNWNARQKALEQGAYSTLATLRFIRSDAQTATAQMLVVGDSCVIIGHPKTKQIEPFPLQHTEDFDRAPYCVPSLFKNLNRYTLYARAQEVTLSPGDSVILATDAVARWIISGGGTGNESVGWNAFMEVAQKTESDWQKFIDLCRAKQSLIDDDSTVIIIRLQNDGRDEERLGVVKWPRPETVALRRKEFERARAENNSELVAITYGDGHMLNAVDVSLPDAEKAHAHEVADALRDVLQIMRDAVNLSNFTARAEQVWWQHADLLMDEPCAENIRKNLAAQGVRLRRPANLQPEPSSGLYAPGGKPTPARDFANQPPRLGNAPAGQSKLSLQQLSGVEPEVARVLTPSVLSPIVVQQQQEQPDLQEFRKVLASRDAYMIASAYHPSFDASLTPEERERLQQAQTRLQLDLSTRLRAALDTGDNAILAVAVAIEDAPVEIRLTDTEKQRIQQARERQAAFEHLLDVLEEGTALQKVEADKATQNRKPLGSADQEQLDMAQSLVEAFRSNNDDLIRSAYETIEFSPLRKHFIFTSEERGRIQQARQERVAIDYFRTILHSGNATLALLLRAYEQIQAAESSLSPDERHVVELAKRFLHYYQAGQQASQLNHAERLEHLVRFYYALYYSSYQIVFTDAQARQIESAKKNVSPSPPLIIEVGKVGVNIAQFLVLYRVKPLYANSQIASLKRRLIAKPPEPERQFLIQSISYWEKQIERRNLPATVLNDLLYQILLEQKFNEEIGRGNARRANVNLEKDVKKEADELVRELRNSISKDALPFPDQTLRDAIMPYAFSNVFERYLQATSSGQTASDWLRERRKTEPIYYYERPEEHAPTTTDQQQCWLFKWWFIRESYDVKSPQGESNNA